MSAHPDQRRAGVLLHPSSLPGDSSCGTFGRPVFLDFQRQYSLKTRRCHFTTVAGVTITSAERQPVHSLQSQTQKMRSRWRSRGRLLVLSRRTS